MIYISVWSAQIPTYPNGPQGVPNRQGKAAGRKAEKSPCNVEVKNE